MIIILSSSHALMHFYYDSIKSILSLYLFIFAMLFSGRCTFKLGVRYSMMKKFSKLSQSDSALPISITLSPDEEKIVRLLKNVVEEFGLTTRIRIVGGWVRDRILELGGKDDIDIAIDNMTGSEFTSYLEKWNTKNGLDQIRFAVIQQNVLKSKHLETGTISTPLSRKCLKVFKLFCSNCDDWSFLR